MTLSFLPPIFVCLLAWTFLYLRIVRPARRHMASARARADMTKCLVELNQGAFLAGDIRDGQYLHDKFYKFLFCAITHDSLLTPSLLSATKYDSNAEKERLRFRREIDALETKTKAVVERAIFSIARKIMSDTPFLFLMFLAATHRLRLDYEKSFVESAEYIAISSPCHSL